MRTSTKRLVLEITFWVVIFIICWSIPNEYLIFLLAPIVGWQLGEWVPVLAKRAIPDDQL